MDGKGDVAHDRDKLLAVVSGERLQGLTIDVLHDEKRLLASFGNFIDGGNMGVREFGGGLGFALESVQFLDVFKLQKLESDPATQVHVPGLPDFAGASLAQELRPEIAREAIRRVREKAPNFRRE